MGNIEETTTTPDAPDRVRTYRLRGVDGRDAGCAQLCRAHVREWSEHYRRGRTMYELDVLGREQAGVCELCAAWGPSRATRREAAREADRIAEGLLAEVGTLTLDAITYSIDLEGLIVAEVDRQRAYADLRSDAAAQFLARAQRARRAVLAALRALREAER